MELTHNREASRYEARIDGRLAGEAHYTDTDGVIDFDHTFVPPEFEGQGIAADLVRFALDDVRASGRTGIRTSCWYVDRWLDRHPDYAGLRG